MLIPFKLKNTIGYDYDIDPDDAQNLQKIVHFRKTGTPLPREAVNSAASKQTLEEVERLVGTENFPIKKGSKGEQILTDIAQAMPAIALKSQSNSQKPVQQRNARMLQQQRKKAQRGLNTEDVEEVFKNIGRIGDGETGGNEKSNRQLTKQDKGHKRLGALSQAAAKVKYPAALPHENLATSKKNDVPPIRAYTKAQNFYQRDLSLAINIAGEAAPHLIANPELAEKYVEKIARKHAELMTRPEIAAQDGLSFEQGKKISLEALNEIELETGIPLAAHAPISRKEQKATNKFVKKPSGFLSDLIQNNKDVIYEDLGNLASHIMRGGPVGGVLGENLKGLIEDRFGYPYNHSLYQKGMQLRADSIFNDFKNMKGVDTEKLISTNNKSLDAIYWGAMRGEDIPLAPRQWERHRHIYRLRDKAQKMLEQSPTGELSSQQINTLLDYALGVQSAERMDEAKRNNTQIYKPTPSGPLPRYPNGKPHKSTPSGPLPRYHQKNPEPDSDRSIWYGV